MCKRESSHRFTRVCILLCVTLLRWVVASCARACMSSIVAICFVYYMIFWCVCVFLLHIPTCRVLLNRPGFMIYIFSFIQPSSPNVNPAHRSKATSRDAHYVLSTLVVSVSLFPQSWRVFPARRLPFFLTLYFPPFSTISFQHPSAGLTDAQFATRPWRYVPFFVPSWQTFAPQREGEAAPTEADGRGEGRGVAEQKGEGHTEAAAASAVVPPVPPSAAAMVN